MKKTLQRNRGPASTLLTTLMALVLVFSAFAHAQDAPDPEDDYDYEPYTYGSTSGVIITAYWGQEQVVTTPTTLGGLPVIAIGPGVTRPIVNMGMGPMGPADWNPKGFSNTGVTSLTISEGVLFIGEAGLASYGLTSVSLMTQAEKLDASPDK